MEKITIPANTHPEDAGFPTCTSCGGNLWPVIEAGLSDDQHQRAWEAATEFACQDCGARYSS